MNGDTYRRKRGERRSTKGAVEESLGERKKKKDTGRLADDKASN